MLQDRWHQLITIAVAVSLVLALVGVGIGVKALRDSKTTKKTTEPLTTILVPRNGAVVSGWVPLSAAGESPKVTAVDFVATGGSLHDTKVATASLSVAGWIAGWNSATVANGVYQIASVGYDGSGRSARSLVIMVKVVNF